MFKELCALWLVDFSSRNRHQAHVLDPNRARPRQCVSQCIGWFMHLWTFNDTWEVREALGVLKSSDLLIYLNSTLGELTISLSNKRQFLSKKSFVNKFECLMEVASLHHAGVPVISFFFSIVLHVTRVKVWYNAQSCANSNCRGIPQLNIIWLEIESY